MILAQLLEEHHWQVHLLCMGQLRDDHGDLNLNAVTTSSCDEIDMSALTALKADQFDVAVCMMSDEENLRVGELLSQYFGLETLVALIRERASLEAYQELGALIVDPQTATVRLLEQCVRSPTTSALLLGMSDHQDLLEIELRDPSLEGLCLSTIRLPLDLLVLSIRREGRHIILAPGGKTPMMLGDRLTVVGSLDSDRYRERPLWRRSSRVLHLDPDMSESLRSD